MEDKNLSTKNQENNTFSLTKEKIKELNRELSEIGHRKAYILNQLNNRENTLIPFLKDALENQFVLIINENQKGILTNLKQDSYNKLTFDLTFFNLYKSKRELIIKEFVDFDLFIEKNFIILDINEFFKFNAEFVLQKKKIF